MRKIAQVELGRTIARTQRVRAGHEGGNFFFFYEKKGEDVKLLRAAKCENGDPQIRFYTETPPK